MGAPADGTVETTASLVGGELALASLAEGLYFHILVEPSWHPAAKSISSLALPLLFREADDERDAFPPCCVNSR
jgi:hypothetical protein